MSLRHHQIEEYAKEIIEHYDITDESALQQAVHEYVEGLVPHNRYKLLQAYHEIHGEPQVLAIEVKDIISNGCTTIEGFVTRIVFDEYYGQLYSVAEDLAFGDEEE